MKNIIKRIPFVGALARKVKAKFAGDAGNPGKPSYVFSRAETEGCTSTDGRNFLQIQNLLNYTKTNNVAYSAQQFPAAYHTLNIYGHRIPGQRDPSKRLALVPIDFRGKTVLDIGCNQGGMIHELASAVKWGVGIDYDSRMINAANRIKNATGANNTSFYVHDLQREPLDLINDYLPDPRVDICFLLSVCIWINNWQEVINFAHAKSHSLLFEANGDTLSQEKQIDYLRPLYRRVNQLSGTSEDDPSDKNRQLFYLTEPISGQTSK